MAASAWCGRKGCNCVCSTVKRNLSQHHRVVSNLCLVFLQPAKAMPSGPRTYSAYDCDDGHPHCNKRYTKWGPKGGVWEREWVRLIGPPVEERRQCLDCCWLCNAKLKVHRRNWTRPGWTRWVSHGSRIVEQPPYERAGTSVENNRNRFRPPRFVCIHDVSTKEEQPSQLDMIIYSCPNGCDADDTLQHLLDQTDHTGPERAPRPR